MKKDDQKLRVKIFWAPQVKKKGFEGEARSVSSKNVSGRFDLLPGHANFISVIEDFLIVRTLEGEKTRYDFFRGVLEVSNDRVRVFLEL